MNKTLAAFLDALTAQDYVWIGSQEVRDPDTMAALKFADVMCAVEAGRIAATFGLSYTVRDGYKSGSGLLRVRVAKR